MSECRDKRFADMLLAYEMGMLDENERNELEIHILECPECNRRVMEFQSMAGFLKDNSLARECISEILQEKDTDKESLIDPGRFGLREIVRRPFFRYAFVAAILVMIIVFQPWTIEIRPSREAVASGNRLVILPFENIDSPADSSHTGEILANLVLTDLDVSSFLQAVPMQRIQDIIRLKGLTEEEQKRPETERQVAREAEAKWLIRGKLSQAGGEYNLTLEIEDIEKENAVDTLKLSIGSDTDLFTFADSISFQIKKRLILPDEALQEDDRPISDITSRSTKAYLHYLEGVDYYGKFYVDDAARSFQSALKYDSTVAMAYYYLAKLFDRRRIYDANNYINHAAPKDRHYIRSFLAIVEQDQGKAISELEDLVKRYPDEKEAYVLLGDYAAGMRQFQKAIINYNRAIELDSFYTTAYNNLAYVYAQVDSLNNAIETLDKYQHFAPGQPNPHDSKGEIYSRFGHFDEAIEEFREALKLKPDFYNSLKNIAFLYILTGNYEDADKYLQIAATNPNRFSRSAVRLYRTYIPLRQGKLEETREMLNEGLALDKLEFPDLQYPLFSGLKLLLKARIMLWQNKHDSALQLLDSWMPDKAIRASRSTMYKNFAIEVLVEGNRITEAKEEAEKLRRELEKIGSPLTSYWVATGYINLAQGRIKKAIEYYEKIPDEDQDFYSNYWLGRAYLRDGRNEAAMNKFKRLISTLVPGGLFFGILNVETHYQLGKAYDGLKRTKMAARQFELMKEIWKGADPEIIDLMQSGHQINSRINLKMP